MSDEAAQRRRKEAACFDETKKLAAQHGLLLEWHTESKFSLCKPEEWRLYLYPGAQRVYRGRGNHAPFLILAMPWTLRDVVKAAAVWKGNQDGAADSAGVGGSHEQATEGMRE